MKVYHVGNAIILPHVRHVTSKGRNSSMMFHSEVERIGGRYLTLGCDKMDDSGFCLGHKMTRDEFLEKYCKEMETEMTGVSV
jgi:hypothetical protein